MNERVVIKRRSLHLILFIIVGSLALITSVIFMIWHRNTGDLAIGILGTVLFGGGLLPYIHRTLTTSQDLVIDEEGFIDNSSYASYGRVYWRDVESIDLYSIVNRGITTKTFIRVHLRHPDEYTQRLNRMNWFIIAINKPFGQNYAIALVDTFGIDLPAEQIANIMRQYHQRNSSATPTPLT